MGLISQHQGDQFVKSQKAAHNTFNKHPITWIRSVGNDRGFMGEDPEPNFQRVDLKCQLNYNLMRTWPITLNTEMGEIDRQSVQVYFGKPYLKELGHITEKGNFDYKPDFDRFEIHGRIYKANGDTDGSQFFEDDLLFTIILRPEETSTQTNAR